MMTAPTTYNFVSANGFDRDEYSLQVYSGVCPRCDGALTITQVKGIPASISCRDCNLRSGIPMTNLIKGLDYPTALAHLIRSFVALLKQIEKEESNG